MKLNILKPLAFCLLFVGCGQTSPNDIDATTSILINGIDNKSAAEVRGALAAGAKADALGAFGNSALHFASQSGDADLARSVLSKIALQKPGAAQLVTALTLLNKESQSALEIAARLGHIDVISSIGSFCENNKVLRAVFFPVAKKLATESSDKLELVIEGIAQFGSAKNHMSQLILETIGTKEGQAILLAHNQNAFLADFAKAYLMALDATSEIQSLFFKIASGFRIEKRSELIEIMFSESAKDLYRNVDRSIQDLSHKFGVIKKATPAPKPDSTPAKGDDNRSNRDNKDIPADQNAVLRDAVLYNQADAVHAALENGARIDALDSNLQNVFHIASKASASEAMTILLSQLQCSNADIVLLQKDTDGLSPFSIAAYNHSDKNKSLRIISEFLLSAQPCQEIAKKEIREWAKLGKEEPIKKTFLVFSEVNHGIEVLADIAFRLVAGKAASNVIAWIEQTLCAQAKDHIWARIYFQAVVQSDDARKLAARNVVLTYGDAERRQIMGFMLFLGSSQPGTNLRLNILNEAEGLNLSRAMFEASSDNVAELKAALDEIVTGQEAAKVSLSVAIKNHYERVEKGLTKSNILILGPSGTGKTLLVQTIAKKLNVPFTIFDATNITQAGYVGGKASDAIASLAEKGGFDKTKIERGIIFLDEIDKMASRSGRSENDEFKRQAQASLLKMLEGIEVEIPTGRFDNITIDTSNILFVCAGAFTGLPEIIDARLKTDGLSKSENVFSQAIAADLIKYGMAPEFLGRLPNVITLNKLSVDDMVHILKNPKSSVLEEYRSLFTERNVEIKFTDGAIRAIAERAVTYNVGARALRTVAESVISDLQFRIGQMGMLKSITVTDRVVKFGDMPTLEYN